MTTNNWNDFNDAESQQSGFDLIPKGTIVPVRMTIKPVDLKGIEHLISFAFQPYFQQFFFDKKSINLALEYIEIHDHDIAVEIDQ